MEHLCIMLYTFWTLLIKVTDIIGDSDISEGIGKTTKLCIQTKYFKASSHQLMSYLNHVMHMFVDGVRIRGSDPSHPFSKNHRLRWCGRLVKVVQSIFRAD